MNLLSGDGVRRRGRDFSSVEKQEEQHKDCEFSQLSDAALILLTNLSHLESLEYRGRGTHRERSVVPAGFATLFASKHG
jgi:hypothetical protein